MRIRLKYVFVAFVFAISFLCKPVSAAEIIVKESFEDLGADFVRELENRYDFKPSREEYAAENMYISDKAFHGRKSMLFVTSIYDEPSRKRERTELHRWSKHKYAAGEARCYATTVMFGDEKFPKSKSEFLFLQVHGSKGGVPRFAISPRPHANNIHIYGVHIPYKIIDSPVSINKWDRWAVYFKSSEGNDGHVIVWYNGRKVYDETTRTSTAGDLHDFKFGRYNWYYPDSVEEFKDQNIKPTSTYHDDLYEIGGEDCVETLKDQAPYYVIDPDDNPPPIPMPTPFIPMPTPTSVEEKSINKIVISAKARFSGGTKFGLRIKGKVVKEYNADSSFDKFVYETKDTLSIGDIKLFYGPEESDKNDLVVKYVKLNGKKYRSNSSSTKNTAHYANGKCGGKGNYPKNRIMHCSGYMKFGAKKERKNRRKR